MKLFPSLVHTLGAALLPVAALMASGSWCLLCSDEKTKECREGTCQDVEFETYVDHEAFQHAPGNVEWGGGD